MKSPFVFGRVAVGDNFLDRENETRLLADNFCNLSNTVLISPRSDVHPKSWTVNNRYLHVLSSVLHRTQSV